MTHKVASSDDAQDWWDDTDDYVRVDAGSHPAGDGNEHLHEQDAEVHGVERRKQRTGQIPAHPHGH